MIENKLIQLLSEGLSWRDSVSAGEQARLLNTGNADVWREEVLSSADAIGVTRTLRQVAYSFRDVHAWGSYLSGVLYLFGLSEIYGLACSPSDLVARVAEAGPETWEDARETARKVAVEYLKKQIEAGDVHLLHPSEFTAPDLCVFVPQIVETRNRRDKDVQPYLMDDGLVDMFDFLELPIAMDLMIKSGIGGRARPQDVRSVLRNLVELGLSPTEEPLARRTERTESSLEDLYLRRFKDCLPHQRDLLRGAAMALDPDIETSRKGLELIHKTGHIHSKEPLIKALDTNDEKSVVYALTGLGMLGQTDVIPWIAHFLDDNSSEVQAAACTALGQLKASQCIEKLEKLLRQPDDRARTAAVAALLRISTAETQQRFWQYVQSLGLSKATVLSNEIGNLRTIDAVLFMVNVLLLDLRACMDCGEIQLFNAFLAAKEEREKAIVKMLSEKLRDQAVAGFGRLGSMAVPVLATLLKDFPQTRGLIDRDIEWDPSESELARAIEWRLGEYHGLFPQSNPLPPPVDETIRSFGMTGSERAIPYLEDLSKASDDKVALLAVEALGEIDTPAIDALIRVPDTNPKVRTLKIANIGSIVHPRATEWLLRKLDESDPLTKVQLVTCLVMRNDPHLNDRLKKVAKDPSNAVRAQLAHVILRLGVDTYPEVLQILGRDEDELVRDSLARARLQFEAGKNEDYWA